MSSEIDTSPIVNVINWADRSTTPGYTNFYVRVDPKGMTAVLTVDPGARFKECFAHMYGVHAALMRSGINGWAEQLDTVTGYLMFYNYCARNVQYESASILQGVTEGFLFEVRCSKDSPLVGWFLVLGVENG